MTTTLIIPGLKSSGPAHWQSWFEEQIPGARRVSQNDWHDANLAAWSSRVRLAISQAPDRVIIAAHSFGALAAVQAASDHAGKVAGLLLVAPADPLTFGVSDYLPLETLPFPTVVVASTNDPWMPIEKAALWADVWGAEFINIGAAGHINVESGFGPWPAGLALFDQLRISADVKAARSLPSVLADYVARRRSRSAVGLGRATAQGLQGDERGRLRRAVLLLEDAGWQVSPPQKEVRVSSV